MLNQIKAWLKTNIKYLIMFVLTVFVLSGCVTQRRCNLKFPPSNKRDSVYIETIKEIPVPIPGDTIKVTAPVINCPDQDIVKVENSKLKQDIKILNGKLIANTQIKPDTVFVPVTETKTVVKEVKVPAPVKFVPKFVKFLAWTGGIALLLILAWGGFKAYTKWFLPIKK